MPFSGAFSQHHSWQAVQEDGPESDASPHSP